MAPAGTNNNKYYFNFFLPPAKMQPLYNDEVKHKLLPDILEQNKMEEEDILE